MEDKNFNRNPDGINQHELRSDTEVQKTIDKHPSWTKADFIGCGKLNPDEKNALLTRTEVDRKNLVFGHVGKRRRPLKDIYKLSTKENILRFENKEINEDTFRKNALNKSYRDKVSISQRKKSEKLRYKNLTEKQLKEKRERNKNYISNLAGKKLEKLIYLIKPNYIFNFAAESHVDRSIDNPKLFIQDNIISSLNLFNTFRRFSKKNKR